MTTISCLNGLARTLLTRGAPLMAALLLAAGSAPVAASPAANTQISSMASASYVDADGVTRTTWSNAVVTTVQQVGIFTVTSGVTRLAAAGATIDVPHTITNTGNGSDTFTITVQDSTVQMAAINVLVDSDGDGVADNGTSLLTGGAINPLTTGISSASTSPITIAAGGSYSYVVRYTLPAVGMPWSETVAVGVTAANATIGYTSLTQSVNDKVTLTTSAAFAASLANKLPSGVAGISGGAGAWPSTAPNSGQRGVSTVYTWTYSNGGAAAGQLYLKDTLPTGMTFVSGSAVSSLNPGVALNEDGSANAGATNITFKKTGQLVEAMINNVAAGSSGTVSFVVVIDGTAPVGTLTSSALYSVSDCASAGLSASTTCTPNNTASLSPLFTVLPTRGVMVGPNQDLQAGRPSSSSDASTVAAVVPGGSVMIPIAVKNTGNADDTFKLTVNNAAQLGTTNPLFPSGTQFTWFASDKSSPLQNTAGGVDVDTGVVSAGATATVYLQVLVPSSTAVAANVKDTVVVTATSAADSTQSDTEYAVVTSVVAGLVDVTSSAAGTANVDIGPGAQSNVISQTLVVTAGGAGNAYGSTGTGTEGSAVFDLYIRNYDSGALTFNLQASSTTGFPGNLPAGWTVKYYAYASDLATSLAGTPTTQVTAGSGVQQHVLAVVSTTTSSAPVAAQDVYFRAISTTAAQLGGAVVSDWVRTQLTVYAPNSRSFVLAPAGGNQQIAAGGSVLFSHALSNSGNTTCGAGGGLTVSLSLPSADATAGWSAVLYEDNGSSVGQLDAGDTVMAATGANIGPLTVGATKNFLVRVFAPGGAVVNTKTVATLVVTDADPAPNCGSQTLQDTATVTAGQLTLTKTQLLDTACNATTEPSSSAAITAKPDQCVIYKSTLTNTGSTVLSNVSLNDTVPNYMSYDATYVGGSAATQCEAVGLSGTAAVFTAPTSTVATSPMSCGSSSNSLNPGGTLTLRFRAKVLH